MTPEDTHDELRRRHHQCEDALWDLPAQGHVGTETWAALDRRETELRRERVNRMIRRQEP